MTLQQCGDIVTLNAIIIKDKKAIWLRDKIKNIGTDKLDEIFEKNTCGKCAEICPKQTIKKKE